MATSSLTDFIGPIYAAATPPTSLKGTLPVASIYFDTDHNQLGILTSSGWRYTSTTSFGTTTSTSTTTTSTSTTTTA